MRDIYSIGDSHSAFNFNHIPEVKPIGLGPITMFRIGRDKTKFEELPEGCIAIFCFGEIDVRTQLANHVGNSEDYVIEKLASDYIDTILLQKDRNIIPVIMGVTPACKGSGLSPYFGTDDDRARYCKKLNNYLRVLCAKNELSMLDIYDYYVGDNGLLIEELSDGANHIWNTKFVEKVFYEFLEKVKNNE